MIILLLIRLNRRTDERSGKKSRARTDRCAATTGRAGADQGAAGRADPRSLADRGLTGGEREGGENRDRGRWQKILFHNAIKSNCRAETDVPRGYSAPREQLPADVEKLR